MDQPNVSHALGHWVAGLTASDIPGDVKERMKLLALDAFGVIIGAATLPEAEPLLDYSSELGGRHEATAVGLRNRIAARSAAFSNAWLADLLDLEDTQKFGGNHPGATMVPAAVAMGERQRLAGAQVMTALIAGYEVANRVARAVFPQSTLRGFLPTGPSGTLGSAATAAKLLALDGPTTAHALNIAGFILPISAADTLWEGESAKPSHAAQAAAAGIDAAALAARGFCGAPLEGGRRQLGYLRMASDTPDLEGITADLGERYTLMDLAFKAYPACGYTHGGIDAAITLHERLGEAVDRIESVTVSTFKMAVVAVGDRYPDQNTSFTAAQFSMPFVVAAALVDGEVGIRQISDRRQDPRIQDLARRTTVIEDPVMTNDYPVKLPYRVDVVVEGKIISEFVDAPVGTTQRPLSEAQIQNKFFDLVVPAVGQHRAHRLANALAAMEEQRAVRWPRVALPRTDT